MADTRGHRFKRLAKHLWHEVARDHVSNGGAALAFFIAFKLYVGSFANYGALYGSLGAVIVLLLWLYVTGWVMLLGGEINDMVQRKDEHEERARREEHPGLVDQHA